MQQIHEISGGRWMLAAVVAAGIVFPPGSQAWRAHGSGLNAARERPSVRVYRLPGKFSVPGSDDTAGAGRQPAHSAIWYETGAAQPGGVRPLSGTLGQRHAL